MSLVSCCLILNSIPLGIINGVQEFISLNEFGKIYICTLLDQNLVPVRTYPNFPVMDIGLVLYLEVKPNQSFIHSLSI